MKQIIFCLVGLLTASMLPCHAETFELDGLKYSTLSDKAVEVTNCYSQQCVITIPNSITYNGNTYDVIQIGDYAFYQLNDLTALSIPDNVRSLGKYAMGYCSNLRRVDIGTEVTEINSLAFFRDNALDTLIIKAVIPPTLTESKHFFNTKKVFVQLGSGASYRQTANWRDNIIIEENEEYTVINVSTPGSLLDSMEPQIEPNAIGRLKVVGEMNNNDWKALRSQFTQLWDIDMTELTNTKIPDSQFDSKTFLCEVQLPANLKELGKQVFFGCTNLKRLVFPESFETLGTSCFQKSNISSVVFNSDVSVGQKAFADCFCLTEIPDEHITGTLGSWAFWNCPLTSFKTSANLEKISNNAFYGCVYLSELILNEGLATIGSNAFKSCSSLTQVILPVSLTGIELGAFQGCSLRQVYAPWSNPISCNTSAFFSYTSDSADCTLYVPQGSKGAYAAATGWNKFTKIQYHEDFNGIEDINSDDAMSSIEQLFNLDGTPASLSSGKILIKEGKKMIIK